MPDFAELFESKVLSAVGNWEPLFHRIRGGNYNVNEAHKYAHEHSEEVVDQLAREGVNLVLLHFYKGMGFEFEKEEMENSRRFIEKCHRHGILVGTYTQWGTFWAETFMDEHPNALNYCQKDRFGRPSLYSETYWAYHRYRVCASSQDFRDFLKQMVRYSVEHVGTDLVYFDNLGQNPCYCDKCRADFKQSIADKYPTSESRIERFGFSKIENFNLPFGADRNPIDCLEIVSDPLVQEWIQFRCDQLYKALKEIRQFIDTLDSKVPMAFNPPVLYGDNAPLVWGTDMFRILDLTRFFYSEDPNVTGKTADGRIITQHRVFKTARALGNSCFRFHTHSDKGDDIKDELLAISEAAVLNDGNLATVKYYGTIAKKMAKGKQDYIHYFRQHEKDYAGLEQISEAAVYKNFESLTWAWPQIYPILTVTEQFLIQSGLQFGYIINNLDDISKYKLLIISDMWCLSESQARQIADYVETGGRLLVTGKTGSRNLWFRRYETNILASTLGQDTKSNDSATYISLGAGAGGGFRSTDSALQKQWVFGKGKVCWIDQVQLSHPINPKVPGQIWMIENTFWDLPKNYDQLTDSVNWLLDTRNLIKIKSPSFVIPQTMKNSSGNILIHFLNYENSGIVTGFEIILSSELGSFKKILFRCPEKPVLRQIEFGIVKDGITLVLPDFSVHCTLILE